MFAKHRAAREAAQAAITKAEITRMLGVAEGREHPPAPIVLKPGEECVHVINGAGLFETRRGPGQWQGRSSGISVPVGAGVRIRTGASRGHYVQGAEAPTIIDTGTVTMTSRRVVFAGPRYTREWDFSKLIGFEHFEKQPWTAIQVSNRQKTSGFTYKGLRLDFVHAWLDLALAISTGQRAQAADQLRTQLAALAPAPVPVAALGPGATEPDGSGAAAPGPVAVEPVAVEPEVVEPWVVGPEVAATGPVAAPHPARPEAEVAEPEVASALPVQPEPAGPVTPPAGCPVDAGRPAVAPAPDWGRPEHDAAMEPARPAEPVAVTAPASAGPGQPAPTPAGGPLPPANWYPDPAGLAPLRWWDGTQWTSYTAGPTGTR